MAERSTGERALVGAGKRVPVSQKRPKAATATTTPPTTTPTTTPGAKPSGAAIPLELQRWAAENNITLGSGGADDDSDPPVYFGGRWGSAPIAGGDPSNPEQGVTYERTWIPDPSYTQKRSEALVGFYALDSNELRSFQEQAFAAGLYGDEVDREDVRWGDYDEATFKAWQKMVDRSAAFLKAGKRVSPWQALADASKNTPAEKGPTRQPLVIRLTNPNDIKSVIGRAASAVTGGAAGLSDEEMDQFVREIHDLERTAQRANYEAGGSGLPGGPGGEVTKGGDIEDMAKKRLFEARPKEAQAYSYLESFNTFMDLIRGSSGAI